MQQLNSSFALKVLLATAFVGISGDLLLRTSSWGLNFPLWIAIGILTGFFLIRSSPFPVKRSAAFMLLPALVFSLCFFWRDSDELKIANGICVVLALGVMALRARSGNLRFASIVEYTVFIIAQWTLLIEQFARLILRDINWRGNEQLYKRISAVVKGLLLAAPLLIVFGLLFASADEAFSKVLTNLFRWDFETLVSNVGVTALAMVVAGGIYRRLFLDHRSGPVDLEPLPPSKTGGLGAIEVGVIFLLLDAMFALFVFVQFRYLFGTSDAIARLANVSYAQYARHGFFELTAVAGCALATLLGTHSVIRETQAKAHKIFAPAAAVLVALVFVVIASALYRMNLYVDSYGLTMLRVYTTSFILWLALAFVWLAATVLRNRRSHFAFGALVAGYVVVLGLNVCNPDGLIARVDLGSRFKSPDVDYLAGLSMDAAPAISEKLSALDDEKSRHMRALLKQHWGEQLRLADWRTINVSRLRVATEYHHLLVE